MFKNLFKKKDGSHVPEIDLNKIFPILKGKLTNSLTNSVVGEPISIQLFDDIDILFAIDKGEQFEFINETTLIALKINKDELRSIAIENLKKYVNLKGINIEGDENIQMIKLDRVLESSLILYDELWTKFCIDYSDDIVISIPSRELLLISLASNPTGIQQLKEGAQDLFQNGHYKLTENLFIKRLDGTLKKME
ncbi:DUF1444 family protein [Lacihabitans sp. LS3-19]|uniref:DUF1444 family protein n=1 Tax=Lacihabitans sp. LS3-19 TaxID=2487335 RepID=UPI0020CF1353|nr:DUF1444 family protein [Lacihabitans sp. LS3-19]MCP9768620.1 DUF1444 family protein [Lacihabitans sp. LS3-19]